MMKGSFKKSFIMFGASLLSMILGFLVSIFNSRVLGAEGFGNFKFIETAARFIGSIVTVGFFISLTRLVAINKSVDKEKKYVGLFVTIFAIASILGILFFIIFAFIEPHLFDNNLEGPIFKFFFIVASIIGAVAIQELLKGLHKINTLALMSVLPIFLYLLLAYITNEFYSLNVEMVLYFTYGISLFIILSTFMYQKPDFKFDKGLVKELLQENKTNGRPIYFGSLAGVATTHIAGFSIAYFMNTTEVGFFMLALTVCTPMLTIPSVLGTVFFKQFVNMPSIPTKVFVFSLLGSLFALLVFYSLIDFAIITFYTKAFLPVSEIAKFLIFGFVFHGYGDLINRFLGAKGKGKWLRNAAFLVGLVNVIGYTLLVKYFDTNGAIITKILASCLYLIVMLRYYLNFTKKNNV